LAQIGYECKNRFTHMHLSISIPIVPENYWLRISWMKLHKIQKLISYTIYDMTLILMLQK
jgi:hypothetical protein